MINIMLLFPIIAGIIMLLVRQKSFSKFLLNIYAILHFIISSLLVFNSSAAYRGAYFAIDDTNKIFLIILSFVFLMVTIYNNGYSKHLDVSNKKLNHYFIMIMAFVLAMTAAILSTDLGIAWILVEGTTLTSAYLIYFNKTKNSIEAAWKYVFICSIGIALAFIGIIFLNISSENLNTLNFAELLENAKASAITASGNHLTDSAAFSGFNKFWLKLSFIFILFGFGTKMGLAPAHFWLPDAHSESPSPISALLSATLLNSAFLVILRVFNILCAAGDSFYGRLMLIVMGFLSLFVAAVFMYHIKNYKRMLAYSSIENMGILAIGTAFLGIAHYAVILHLIGHSLAKASFFLTSGNVLELYETKKIKDVTGLMEADKKTGWLWILSLLGICAFPTSILFISEFLIIKTMLANGHYIMCIAFALLLTVILFGMARVVIKMTFGKLSEEKLEIIEKNRNKITVSMYIPQVIMLTIIFILGVYIPSGLNNIIKAALTGFLG